MFRCFVTKDENENIYWEYKVEKAKFINPRSLTIYYCRTTRGICIIANEIRCIRCQSHKQNFITGDKFIGDNDHGCLDILK